METKQELVNNIKQWLQMDDEIKQLQKQIKERRNIKKQLTQTHYNVQLIWFLKRNNHYAEFNEWHSVYIKLY